MDSLIKKCKLCNEEVKVSQIETFPLVCNNFTFEPKSKLIFCTKPCVKRFLQLTKKKTYLLTLYALYLLLIKGIVALEAAPDILSLACRQVNPTKDSITKDKFHKRKYTSQQLVEPKECALCFLHFTWQPFTYVTHKLHDLFQFANVAFCSRECTNRFIGDLDPNFRELYSEYRRTIHHDCSDSFSRDPECLIYFLSDFQKDEKVEDDEEQRMTYEEYHKNFKIPKPIYTEHYYSMEVLPIPRTEPHSHTILVTFEKEQELLGLFEKPTNEKLESIDEQTEIPEQEDDFNMLEMMLPPPFQLNYGVS
jgi:hypothetical protein